MRKITARQLAEFVTLLAWVNGMGVVAASLSPALG